MWVGSRSGRLDVTLTPDEALLVMADYLGQHARLHGDDLLTLLGDMQLMPDGRTFDPAVWDDWVASVKWIKAGGAPR